MWFKIVGSVAGILVVALIAIAAAVYYGYVTLPWLSTTPEQSARYYPDDVVFYTYMTLNPGGKQTRDMVNIFSRLMDMCAIRDLEDDMEDDLDDETGIEFDDIGDWVGWEISMALMEAGRGGEIEAAGTVDVRDRSLANEFVEDLIDYMEDENYSDYDKDSYHDFDVWIDQNDKQQLAFALSDNLMVAATTEDSLEDVLDRISGDINRTLANDENFQEARAALPNRRFASMYVSYDNLLDYLEDTSEAGIFYEGGGCGEQFFQTPDWIAGSAGWVDRGLIFDVVSPTVGDAWPDSPELIDVSKVLSVDTLGFIAVSFNPDMDVWRDALQECKLSDVLGDSQYMSEEVESFTTDLVSEIESLGRVSSSDSPPELDIDSSLDEALDMGLWAADQLIGIDVEKELLDHLRGDLIVAVNDFDIRAVEERPERNPVEGVIMLSYHPDRETELQKTTNEIVSLLEDEFDLDFDRTYVGTDSSARILEVPDTDYAFGYVLHDGFLTIGTTEDVLESTVSIRDDDKLSSVSEYNRAVRHLPDNRDMLGYVDLQKAIDMARDFDQYDTIDRDVFDALEDSLSVLVFSSSLNGEHSRFTMVLTMFP